jgi:hypothetical protein
MTSLLTVVILGVSFLLILGLKYAQVKYFQDKELEDVSDSVRTLLSLAITICINIVNMMLVPLIKAITLKEKYGTVTRFNISVARRVAYVQFFNTSIIIVLVNWLIDGKRMRVTIWENKGLSNDAWFILLGNIILPPL